MVTWTDSSVLPDEKPARPFLVYIKLPDDKFGRVEMAMLHWGRWCQLPGMDDIPNEWVLYWSELNSPDEFA